MKVTLSPKEVLHVLVHTIQHPISDSQTQQTLIGKLKSSLLETLENFEEQQNVNLFHDWEAKEVKKLQDLKNENLSISIKSSGSSTMRTARRRK
jgi:hypothetical protein